MERAVERHSALIAPTTSTPSARLAGPSPAATPAVTAEAARANVSRLIGQAEQDVEHRLGEGRGGTDGYPDFHRVILPPGCASARLPPHAPTAPDPI